MWGPYANLNFDTWDKTKTEQTQTQFLKRVLGCGINTSNIMVRAETGRRPLLNQIIKKYVLYLKALEENASSLSNDALKYEKETYDPQNESIPIENFTHFVKKFHLDLDTLKTSKSQATKTCNDAYDRKWKNQITDNSSKAISYCKYKSSIHLEPYLSKKLNNKERIAISRFRMSNHSLMIEKGRHVKPNKIKRNERYCPFCKNEVEDEEHFLISCPLYTPFRIQLEKFCKLQSNFYDSLDGHQKFIFILSNENESIIKKIATFIMQSMNLREKIMKYFVE